MSTTLLSQAVQTDASAASRPAHVLATPEARRAALYDLIHPWALDLSGFVAVVAAELKGRPRPTVIELGCGTGQLALPLMKAVHPLAYYAFDDSQAMVQRLNTKARALPVPPDLHVTSPIDLLRKISAGMVSRAPRADVVLMSRFLQTIPPFVASDEGQSRTDMIKLGRQLARPGGRLVIIEDVFGESVELHQAAQAAWDGVICAGLDAQKDHLLGVLPALEPDMAAMVESGDRLGLVRAVRAVLDRGLERQPLPLSTWRMLLDRMGLRYRCYHHATLSNVWLFSIEC